MASLMSMGDGSCDRSVAKEVKEVQKNTSKSLGEAVFTEKPRSKVANLVEPRKYSLIQQSNN